MAGISRRRLLHGAAVALVARRPAFAQAADVARQAMAAAATAFLGALDTPLRRRATYEFTERERLNWHYVPRQRRGVPFKDMKPAARAAAHELLKASLSVVGYAKALDVIALESVLREMEMFGLMRDPENYAFTVFGAPGDAAPWGWRCEGHHLSLNFTLAPGRPIAVTPAFLGANPATVRSGPRAGLRALEHEQDLGLALARAVDPALRGQLVIAAESLGDVVSGPGRRELFTAAPAGVPLGALGGDQRAVAIRLIETYARTMRAEIAEEELRRLREAGLEKVHFAWAGAIDPSRPHYYRLHGPTLLIEYDNTQNSANHVHTVWHDPVNDFGGDALRAHYTRGHRHG